MDGLEGAPVEVTDQQPVEPTTTSADVTPEVESFTDLDLNEPDGGFTPDWLQDRHKAMQGDYTRKTQAHAEAVKQHQEELAFLEALKSDPDTQLAVLEELSQLLSESDDDSDDEALEGEGDQPNPLEGRIAELENERATERAQALGKEIASHIDQLAKDAGVDLDDDDLHSIFEKSVGGNEIGKQQTEAAFKAWHARETSRHEKWQAAYLASKTAAAQVPAGTSATDAPDLNDRDTRLRRFAAMLQGGDA